MVDQREASRIRRERTRINSVHEDNERQPHLERFFAEDIQGGSKSVQQSRRRWGQRFDSFRESKHIDSGLEPTINELQQFVTVWCHAARSTDGRQVVRWDTVKYGVKLLSEYFALRYGSFELTKADWLRLQGTMEQLEQAGHISRDTIIPRVPIGILAIRELILIMIRSAVWNGTISWSFTMQDIAMIVIIASLNARAGDVTVPSSYEAHTSAHYLTYEDVELKVSGDTISSIQGRWRMRNCKGEKKDAWRFFHMRRNALTNHEDNILCPVRLLLILAMRSGNAPGTSVQAILELARARQDRRIVWRNAKLPVFAKRDSNKSALIQTESAGYGQVREVLRKATQISGCSHLIRPHDLRGGAAVDLATVADRLQGSVLPKVAAELNHNSRSLSTTRRYTHMHTTQDTWAVRTEITSDDQPFNDVTFKTPAIVRPPTLSQSKQVETSANITDECIRNGDDPKDRKSRQNASYRIKRAIGENAIPVQLKSTFQDGQPKESRWKTYSSNEITAECKRKGRDPEDDLERRRAKDRLRNIARKDQNVATTKDLQFDATGESALLDAASDSLVVSKPADSGAHNMLLPELCASQGTADVGWELNVAPTGSWLRGFLLEVEFARWSGDQEDANSRRIIAKSPRLPQLTALASVQAGPHEQMHPWMEAIRALAYECGNLWKRIITMQPMDKPESKKRKGQATTTLSSKRQKTALQPAKSATISEGPTVAADPTGFTSPKSSKVLLGIPEDPDTSIAELFTAADDSDDQAGLSQIMDADLTDLLQDGNAPPNDPEALKCLTSDCFVDHYAQVNIIRLSRRVPTDKPGPAAWQTAQRLGSDTASSVREPIQFLKRCQFESNGCAYKSPDSQHMSEHEETCIYKAKKPEKSNNYQWPKQCAVPDCMSDQHFDDADELQAHNLETHPAKGKLRPSTENLSCPIAECNEKRTSNSFLRAHLRETHHLDKERVEELCPALTCGMQQCLYPGCGCDEHWSRKDYFKHLNNHGVIDINEKWKYTRERVLGIRPPTTSVQNEPLST